VRKFFFPFFSFFETGNPESYRFGTGNPEFFCFDDWQPKQFKPATQAGWVDDIVCCRRGVGGF
jgi:hypothetical protein